MSCRKLKIARLSSMTACMIGIIRVIGACSVVDQKLFYLYVQLGFATFAAGAFALEYFRIKGQQSRKRKEMKGYERRKAA